MSDTSAIERGKKRFDKKCKFQSISISNSNGGDLSIQVLDQGDQIGRIFAYWAIVSFGRFKENFRSNPNFWAIFSTVKVKH
jgi:hypothetical protein